ncbi:MAG TPA: cellulase family glycosylhydrolase [Polyangiaceae bacterium]|nr:cellulase family glycosylhydrolase [Polyangiaceae bacterium]
MRRSVLAFPALALGLAAAPLASCDSSGTVLPAPDASPGPAARTDPNAVHVVGTTFRDSQGRQLLFRGYNAKVTTLFDVTFDDGRTPEETFPDLSEAETSRVEELGWNVLRIPLSWSGLEPQPQQYAAAWMEKLDAVLAMAHEHAFYVILDMHQDAYSKEIGEDGEPLWAIVPPPTQLLEGPYDDSRRLTAQVLSAGYSFFDDDDATDGRDLQGAYVAAVQQVAQHVVGDPAVLGYEAFNEPVVLDYELLDAFHQTFAAGIHAVDADAPVLFEPVSTRNETDDAIVPAAPWSSGPGAYAVHIYTGIFSMPGAWTAGNEDASLLAPSMAHADLERAGWGTPMFVTEFGCDQTQPQGPVWMSDELDLQDQYLASSTAWELSGLGAWGFHDDDGDERPATTRVMARMFPRAVAGDLLRIERPAVGDMIVHYRPTAATAGLPHEVSLSADYVTSPAIFCDGQPVAFTPLTGRATFTCSASDSGEHTFEVRGTAAP